jgi:UDP-N-acetylglucosamine:LPS N-acetylglucosamine transferase
MKGEALFVRGKPESNEELTVPGNITVKNHLPGNELEEAILQSEYIICRSGYTTVMELISLQKKSILVPTPGQTEQEYLADWLQEKQFCISIPQSDFIWDSAIEKTKTFPYQTLSLPIFTDQTLAELLADL